MKSGGGPEKMVPARERTRSVPSLTLDILDVPSNSTRPSFSRDSTAEENDVVAAFGAFGSIDITGQSLDFSTSTTSPRNSSARQSTVSTNFGFSKRVIALVSCE